MVPITPVFGTLDFPPPRRGRPSKRRPMEARPSANFFRRRVVALRILSEAGALAGLQTDKPSEPGGWWFSVPIVSPGSARHEDTEPCRF